MIQNETVLLQQPVFLQAEEEEGILLPVNHIVTKKQCKGKGKAIILLCFQCARNVSQKSTVKHVSEINNVSFE